MTLIDNCSLTAGKGQRSAGQGTKAVEAKNKRQSRRKLSPAPATGPPLLLPAESAQAPFPPATIRTLLPTRAARFPPCLCGKNLRSWPRHDLSGLSTKHEIYSRWVKPLVIRPTKPRVRLLQFFGCQGTDMSLAGLISGKNISGLDHNQFRRVLKPYTAFLNVHYILRGIALREDSLFT